MSILLFNPRGHPPDCFSSERSKVLTTNGNTTVRENIANVFGAKTLSHIMDLNLKLCVEPEVSTLARTDADAGRYLSLLVLHIPICSLDMLL
jgi:hypothetical protein